MIERQARRSGVFLLELMISILFFCIAAAVGLQLFVNPIASVKMQEI